MSRTCIKCTESHKEPAPAPAEAQLPVPTLPISQSNNKTVPNETSNSDALFAQSAFYLETGSRHS